MEWRSRGEARWLEAALPGAKAVFSTRTTGSAWESREPLAAALGIEPEAIAVARQVHGAALVEHHTDVPSIRCPNGHSLDGTSGVEPLEADGHVIAEPGPVGLVFVADCLPVALAGPGGAAILHCGWRGLASGIVASGVEAVRATHAAIGPGIGLCCYEVGEEVLDAFDGLGDGVARDGMLDLPEVARRLLREAGVEQIESAGFCTRCEPELFFSHRREAGRAGRQAGLVWLDGKGI